MHQSLVAVLVMFLSIPTIVVLFNSLPRERAVSLTLIGAALFLPQGVAIDVPYLTLQKITLPPLILTILAILSPRKLPQSREGSGFLFLLFALQLTASVGCVLTNRHPVVVAPGKVLAGLNVTNIFSQYANDILKHVLPFYLGERLLGSRKGAIAFLETISICGLIYVVLMLIELRFSPQLNYWVYGYHQHDFKQAMREGGYRPLVFTAHGLMAALYMVTAFFAALIFHAIKRPLPFMTAKWRAIVVFGIIAVIKSLGALIYAVLFPPLFWLLKPTQLRRIFAIGGVIILAYPLFRAMDVIPTDDILEFFEGQSADRAASLRFRFWNEDALLEQWKAQPWFGTGGGERKGIYNQAGYLISVFDGEWIIALTSQGYVGYFTEFFMYVGPIFFARRALSAKLKVPMEDQVLLAGMAMIVFVHAFELLINGLFTNIVSVSAGVLLGLSRSILAERKAVTKGRMVPQRA